MFSTSQKQTVTAGLQPNENNQINTKGSADTRWSAYSEATKKMEDDDQKQLQEMKHRLSQENVQA